MKPYPLSPYEVATSSAVIAEDPIHHLPAEPQDTGLSEYEDAFGEKPAETLDLDSWIAGEDLPALYARLEREVQEAVEEEEGRREHIRRVVFPQIGSSTYQYSAPDAGLHRFTPAMIERAHRGFLFNGAVEAADGTLAIHDTLPVTITQVGVCLVSYHGLSGSYVHRLFRKDLRARGSDPVQEVLELLKRRQQRGSTDHEDVKDRYGSLYMRSVMAWAERAFLLERSEAQWRMGHGNPTPYELVTGEWASDLDMQEAALDLMRQLFLEHRRFLYIPSAPSERWLLTLGNALLPLEYLIVETHFPFLDRIEDTGAYGKEARSEMKKFVREVGPEIVRGLYRVSEAAPPYLFYAHRDFVHEAALIAMADSALQLHRGFPMLIDLADRLCHASFGADDFLASVRLAHSQNGSPFRYLGERETRS